MVPYILVVALNVPFLCLDKSEFWMVFAIMKWSFVCRGEYPGLQANCLARGMAVSGAGIHTITENKESRAHHGKPFCKVHLLFQKTLQVSLRNVTFEQYPF